MEGKIALFDMDGTLFDHDLQLRKDMLSISSSNDIEVYKIDKDDLRNLEKTHWIKNRIDLIRKQPGWWRNLPKFTLGWQIYEIAKEIGFCCKILTKGPRSKPMAWMEKVQCIHDHFGEEMPIDIVGKDKGGTYGRVLIDDFPNYLEKWLKYRPRGLAIMPAHDYNAGFEHENVIRFTGSDADLVKVRLALKASWDRKEKQHWKELLT